jgi:hypothetical protein
MARVKFVLVATDDGSGAGVCWCWCWCGSQNVFVAFLVGSKSYWQEQEQPGPRSDTNEGSKVGGTSEGPHKE